MREPELGAVAAAARRRRDRGGDGDHVGLGREVVVDVPSLVAARAGYSTRKAGRRAVPRRQARCRRAAARLVRRLGAVTSASGCASCGCTRSRRWRSGCRRRPLRRGGRGGAGSAMRGEPLRESAHRVLIRVHLAEGNRAKRYGGTAPVPQTGCGTSSGSSRRRRWKRSSRVFADAGDVAVTAAVTPAATMARSRPAQTRHLETSDDGASSAPSAISGGRRRCQSRPPTQASTSRNVPSGRPHDRRRSHLGHRVRGRRATGARWTHRCGSSTSPSTSATFGPPLDGPDPWATPWALLRQRRTEAIIVRVLAADAGTAGARPSSDDRRTSRDVLILDALERRRRGRTSAGRRVGLEATVDYATRSEPGRPVHSGADAARRRPADGRTTVLAQETHPNLSMSPKHPRYARTTAWAARRSRRRRRQPACRAKRARAPRWAASALSRRDHDHGGQQHAAGRPSITAPPVGCRRSPERATSRRPAIVTAVDTALAAAGLATTATRPGTANLAEARVDTGRSGLRGRRPARPERHLGDAWLGLAMRRQRGLGLRCSAARDDAASGRFSGGRRTGPN